MTSKRVYVYEFLLLLLGPQPEPRTHAVTVAMHACRLTGTSSRVIGSNCRGAIVAIGALRFESPPEAPGSSLHPNVAVEGMVASCNCN